MECKYIALCEGALLHAHAPKGLEMSWCYCSDCLCKIATNNYDYIQKALVGK